MFTRDTATGRSRTSTVKLTAGMITPLSVARGSVVRAPRVRRRKFLALRIAVRTRRPGDDTTR